MVLYVSTFMLFVLFVVFPFISFILLLRHMIMGKSDSGRIVLHKTLFPSVSLSELFSARRESVRIIDEIDRAIVRLRGSGYDGLEGGELFTRVCEDLGIVHYSGVGFVFSPLFDDKLWCTYVISVVVDDDEGDIGDTYIMDDVGSRKGLICFLRTLRYLIVYDKFKRYDRLKRWWMKLIRCLS